MDMMDLKTISVNKSVIKATDKFEFSPETDAEIGRKLLESEARMPSMKRFSPEQVHEMLEKAIRGQ